MFRTYECINCSAVFLKEQDLMGHIKRVHEASTRDTEIYTRAQASDYSRNRPSSLTILDILVMYFAGVAMTLLFAVLIFL